ncbi:MAG: cytochrome c oxidase accessory protein CcoG [Deltaproteobacteria bacterium]|nr:cytochrome c oxidase accessory protein CcoG [Deltaproteobacteria bacterium]
MAKAAPSIDTLFSVGPGGARSFLHPAAAHGRFTRLRHVGFALLIALFVALPFIQINGRPGIWLDIGRRSFHVLGLSVGPTESLLLFFLVAGSAFTLVVVSALWGRVWCGWACPQTVWLEGVYRRIERLFEGDRAAQLRLEAEPMGLNKLWRKGGKSLAFLLVSAAIAHLLVCYFVPPRDLWLLMGRGPASDPEVFFWSAALTGLVLFNFAWFREQLCIILCPYGRLQSVLSDEDTVVVGYDAGRGEPRGKPGHTKGDCVDCGRCVAVCPTGIDIRQGLQLECVGCASCIDACDEVMGKLQRARGLIRYDSERGFTGGKRRFLRPRVYAYAAVGLVGLTVALLAGRTRPEIPVSLVRQVGMPFVVESGKVRNSYLLRTANKSEAAQTLSIEVTPGLAGASVTLPRNVWTLPAGESAAIPVFVEVPKESFAAPFDVTVRVQDQTGRKAELHAQFLGPGR